MKKSKAKASGAVERDLVFGFRAGQHRCELTVPLTFPVEGDVSDLHGRLMLLHKIPCFMEDGESGGGGTALSHHAVHNEIHLTCSWS